MLDLCKIQVFGGANIKFLSIYSNAIYIFIHRKHLKGVLNLRQPTKKKLIQCNHFPNRNISFFLLFLNGYLNNDNEKTIGKEKERKNALFFIMS